MQVWGLNVIDLIVILTFLVLLLFIGLSASHGVKKETDFYQGGRSLGKVLQFFLQFGNSTDSTGAVQIAENVYKSGASGIWAGGLQTLFITPFFWFTQPWWRRARLMTMGDLFTDRFNSKSAACLYAAFSIFGALLSMGLANLAAFKVCTGMVVKPADQYTQADKTQVALYWEYKQLKTNLASGKLSPQDRLRYTMLNTRYVNGDLSSSISYVSKLPFYISYSAIVGIYVVLGGLRAAAITDALQGLLILVMSVILIPIGVHRIGGFHQLHAVVPAEMFKAFTGEITWYSISAIVIASILQVVGLLHNMSTGGSARDEDTARFGMISGAFTKRLVLICWLVCGLLAVGLVTGLSDPNEAWGALSRQILPAGLVGLMLSGMLLGHMPSVGVWAVSVAGLATRNVYQPLRSGLPEKHYLRVAQWSVVGVLVVSVMIAMFSADVQNVYTMMITFNSFFGAAVLLLIFWRRLTPQSIIMGSVVWIMLLIVVPWGLPQLRGFRQSESLLRTVNDRSLYFDNIVLSDPDDVHSPREGAGRFNVETYLLHCCGVPVEHFSSAGFVTIHWLLPAVIAFAMLIILSLLTRPPDLERSDRFFAKMRTPIAPTPEEDKEQVQLSYANPHRFDHKKLFPGSNWQFAKWTPKDFIGFFGCWGIVGMILVFLYLVLRVGS